MRKMRWLGIALALLLMSLGLGVYAQDAQPLANVTIYFTEANGEASRFDRSGVGIARFAGLLGSLGARLETLDWRTGIPDDADIVIIAGPNTDLSPDRIARLWAFLVRGGRLLLLANPVAETARNALQPAGNLFALFWTDLGLRARGDVVGTIGGSVLQTVVNAAGQPEVVRVSEFLTELDATTFSAHPVTAGISQVTFFGARSIELGTPAAGVQSQPLVVSERNYYGETDYAAYLTERRIQYDIGTDTAAGALALVTASVDARTAARIIVIGDRELATDGRGLQTAPAYSRGFLYPDNARLLVNAVTWLAGRDNILLSFPTPAATETPTITPTPTFAPEATATPTPFPQGRIVPTPTPRT